MPNLYHVAAGVSRSADLPTISTHHRKQLRAKSSMLSGKNTVFTKSNSFMFLERPQNNQDDSDEYDSDNEIILIHSPNTLATNLERVAAEENTRKKQVMFDPITSSGGIAYDFQQSSSLDGSTTMVKKDRPLQRKPIHDLSPQMLRAMNSKELASDCVLPIVTEPKTKRKYEMINTKWSDSSSLPMVSIPPSGPMFSDSLNTQYHALESKRKKKKETPDIYQPQKKSFWQSLFSL
ncbi:hypothetical protein FDP41_009953 [Naegleria fowleri]|uniref:Uncharacterized protein n=1 Tax=Naegleria fowleri TaxID=5763 RepID=A0A6A5BCB4_NAEFO|nr:uncharacterized protein FDP41_009953 [Naegleria fowleri]KAF0971730.1 hypothetical protein FDP41_009953 [Naegleria fowleri]CAG4719686.1 unnamed protein product [Naegleria fowleri]